MTNRSLTKPRYNPNSTEVGVLSLSSPLNPTMKPEFSRNLKSLGVQPEYLNDPFRGYGQGEFLFASASPSARSEDLKRILADSNELRFVLASRGGYGSAEILPLLGSGLKLADRPPVLVGFSDVTAVLLGLYHLFRIVSFHGPSLLSFRDEVGEGKRREAWRDLNDLLEGGRDDLFPSAELHHLNGPAEGVSGVLLGGNLSTIASLIGSPYLPSFNEAILLLEEINEPPFRVHRSLSQLANAGVFDQVRGVVFGDMSGCRHPAGSPPELEEVLKAVFESFSIPVYSGAPFGHEGRNMPFPIGIQARLASDGITLLESATAEG